MTRDRLLKVSEAAELLAVSVATVYRLGARRAIAVFRDPVTGTTRFSAESIDAYIAANLLAARPPVSVVPPPRARTQRTRIVAAPASDGADPPWKGFARIPKPGEQRRRPKKNADARR